MAGTAASTVVVAAAEHRTTVGIDDESGRDHHRLANSAMGGGGVRSWHVPWRERGGGVLKVTVGGARGMHGWRWGTQVVRALEGEGGVLEATVGGGRWIKLNSLNVQVLLAAGNQHFLQD